MNNILLTLLIGIFAGVIDIAPMIKMKLDKYACISAFIFYFTMPFIIFNLDILNNIWWIKGGIICFILELPVLVLVAKEDKKGMIPIAIMSIVLGTLIGVVGHYLSLM